MRPVLILLLLLFVLVAGCSAESRLAGRAAHYYSFMAGHNQRGKMSSFYSPAYRKHLGAEGLKVHNSLEPTPGDTVRYPRATARDVATRIEGRFAMTVANPKLGDVYANQRVTKWVKVGMGWYLWRGSADEVDAYGAFPVGMPPPRFTAESE